jgi:signal transduction histidine kinase
VKLRLWPHSLLGQMLLAVALALLVAQTISVGLLVRAQEQRREELLISGVAFRLVAPDFPAAAFRTTTMVPGRPNPPQRIGLLHLKAFSPQAGDVRRPARELQLHDLLERQGYSVHEVRVYSRRLGNDRFVFDRLRARPLVRGQAPRRANDELLVAALQARPGSEWVVARVAVPGREPGALAGIITQTLILYVVLVGGLGLLLRRITRPLAALTKRVEHFGNTRETGGQLEPAGPADTRRLIAAHNAMEARIGALLDEKDVMLGAIGHDLKTPLAALRVRIESVEDAVERTRMALTIEDITRTLDDILSLARVGRPTDQPESTELAALVASVVEEFEDMGESVDLCETSRIALPVRATWLRRALRNLIANALRYGCGKARVSLLREDGTIAIRVDDDGPGIPNGEIAAMLEPFRRGEPSRSKETGGAGLGLTLARAIAEQHGGSLSLSNRLGAGGKIEGLRAEVRLPVRS